MNLLELQTCIPISQVDESKPSAPKHIAGNWYRVSKYCPKEVRYLPADIYTDIYERGGDVSILDDDISVELPDNEIRYRDALINTTHLIGIDESITWDIENDKSVIVPNIYSLFMGSQDYIIYDKSYEDALKLFRSYTIEKPYVPVMKFDVLCTAIGTAMLETDKHINNYFLDEKNFKPIIGYSVPYAYNKVRVSIKLDSIYAVHRVYYAYNKDSELMYYPDLCRVEYIGGSFIACISVQNFMLSLPSFINK